MLKIIYKTDLLKKRMTESGWDPDMVASKSGVHATTVANILIRGTGQRKKVLSIALALGFPVSETDMRALQPRMVDKGRKTA